MIWIQIRADCLQMLIATKQKVAASKKLIKIFTSVAVANTRFLPFDLNLGVKVILSVAQYPLNNVTYAPAKFEIVSPAV